MVNEAYREDIEIPVADYEELIKWVRIWHKRLALIIEETKEESRDQRERYTIILRKDKIPQQEAEKFLESLMDAEIYSENSEDLKYSSNLVELWRPIAEGPL